MRRAPTLVLILTVSALAAPASLTVAQGKPESPGAHGRARAALHEAGPPEWAGSRHAREEDDLPGDTWGGPVFEPELSAKVQPVGVTGSFLNVRARAKVRGPRDADAAFSATAIVHFASGDVELSLPRMGRSLVARALVPIPPDEPAGEIGVSVTVGYGDAVATFELLTSIVAAGQPGEGTEPDETTEPGEGTEPDEATAEATEPDEATAEGSRLAARRASRPI